MKTGVSAILVTIVFGCSALPASASGWYLVAPPTSLSIDDGWVITKSEPSSEWNQLSAYDTARECEAQRATFRTAARGVRRGQATADASTVIRWQRDRTGRLVKLSPEDSAYVDLVMRGNAQCIASDDQRLRPPVNSGGWGWLPWRGWDWLPWRRAPDEKPSGTPSSSNDPLGIRR